MFCVHICTFQTVVGCCEILTPRRWSMDSKDTDRSRSGLQQTLGGGDAKPVPPPSTGKNEVCIETWFVVALSTYTVLL